MQNKYQSQWWVDTLGIFFFSSLYSLEIFVCWWHICFVQEHLSLSNSSIIVVKHSFFYVNKRKSNYICFYLEKERNEHKRIQSFNIDHWWQKNIMIKSIESALSDALQCVRKCQWNNYYKWNGTHTRTCAVLNVRA